MLLVVTKSLRLIDPLRPQKKKTEINDQNYHRCERNHSIKRVRLFFLLALHPVRRSSDKRENEFQIIHLIYKIYHHKSNKKIVTIKRNDWSVLGCEAGKWREGEQIETVTSARATDSHFIMCLLSIPHFPLFPSAVLFIIRLMCNCDDGKIVLIISQLAGKLVLMRRGKSFCRTCRKTCEIYGCDAGWCWINCSLDLIAKGIWSSLCGLNESLNATINWIGFHLLK